jgi:hypothetical protein
MVEILGGPSFDLINSAWLIEKIISKSEVKGMHYLYIVVSVAQGTITVHEGIVLT